MAQGVVGAMTMMVTMLVMMGQGTHPEGPSKN